MGLVLTVTAMAEVVLVLLILLEGPQGAPPITRTVRLHAPRLTALLLILAVDTPSGPTPTTTGVEYFLFFAGGQSAPPFFSRLYWWSVRFQEQVFSVGSALSVPLVLLAAAPLSLLVSVA